MAQVIADAPTQPAADADGFPSPSMPHRVMVRAYRSYAAGASAIERLERECGIPDRRVTLVARGLSPSTADTAACMRSGARRGSIIGAVCALVLVLSGAVAADVGAGLPLLSGAVFGALTGAAVGLVDRFDCGIAASHYDVLVDEEVAAKARRALTA